CHRADVDWSLCRTTGLRRRICRDDDDARGGGNHRVVVWFVDNGAGVGGAVGGASACRREGPFLSQYVGGKVELAFHAFGGMACLRRMLASRELTSAWVIQFDRSVGLLSRDQRMLLRGANTMSHPMNPLLVFCVLTLGLMAPAAVSAQGRCMTTFGSPACNTT